MSKSKANLTGIGILSRFAIMHYFSKQVGIDARVVKEEDRVVDLKAGAKIAPNLKLRLASKEDADLLGIYPTSTESMIQYSLLDYVLECSLDVDDNSKARGDASHKIRHMIKSAVIALRLLKPGYVDANVVLWVTTRGSKKDTSLMAEKVIRSDPFDRYYLRTDELSELSDLVKRVSSIDFESRKSLRIALDRFARSYDEIEDEDKLVDCMISLEALFLEGEKSRGGQHTVIPIACAMLLGRSEGERQEIKKLLNLAYEIRNRVVHGSEYENKLGNYELEELVEEVEDKLRRSMKKLI